ncbi:YesL family protein [Niallia taxi]|uniref:YesL family protein n=1 Tax=Niallia taxi TaxID=2499688 RepID=UPI003D29FB0C
MLKSVEKLNSIFTSILNLVYVNVLWVLFTLLGLGVFGIGPSTYALVSICRQWIRGNRIPVFETYWKYYKENFKESVLISWIYLFVGFVIAVDLLTVINWYLRAALLIVGFIYLLSLVYIFPIMAHYNWNGILLKMKMSLLFGIACLQYSLLFFLVAGVLYWAAITFFPGVLTFFGVSFLFFLITWTANQVFTRMEMEDSKEININEHVKENCNEKTNGIKVS